MPWKDCTIEEQWERKILSLMMREMPMFGIPVEDQIDLDDAAALLRLQMKDWLRLIDVRMIQVGGRVVQTRLFRVMPDAVAWFKDQETPDSP